MTYKDIEKGAKLLEEKRQIETDLANLIDISQEKFSLHALLPVRGAVSVPLRNTICREKIIREVKEYLVTERELVMSRLELLHIVPD